MRALIRVVVAASVAAAALLGTTGGQAASPPGRAPSLSWSPATGGAFDFGAQADAAEQQFTLTNSGGSASAALTVMVSPPSGPFTITADGCTGRSLGPRKSCVVTVRYSPGTGSDSATLSAGSPKPSTVPASLTLKGARLAGEPLTTSSPTAGPSLARAFAWTISKSVDKSQVTQPGGTATFHYTVMVGHDAGTDSGWKVDAHVGVDNPNVAADDVSGVTVSPTVDNGGTCASTGGLTVAAQSSAAIDLLCTYGSTPSPSAGTVTFTVSWPAQTLHSGALLAAGSTTATATFDFGAAFQLTEHDQCVAVSDTFDTGTPMQLGTACLGDGTPTTFTYTHTVNAPTSGCQSYPNTATFTTNTTGTTGFASQTVQACFGPIPAIAITKEPKSQTVTSGGTATWTIVVTNVGGTDLFNVNVTDALAPNCAKTSAEIGVFASMAPGASVTYNCSLANVTSSFTNVAHATGTPPSGPDVTATDTAPVTVT
jgi:uncharacterized repeat protein (TIGR01451 family)